MLALLRLGTPVTVLDRDVPGERVVRVVTHARAGTGGRCVETDTGVRAAERLFPGIDAAHPRPLGRHAAVRPRQPASARRRGIPRGLEGTRGAV